MAVCRLRGLKSELVRTCTQSSRPSRSHRKQTKTKTKSKNQTNKTQKATTHNKQTKRRRDRCQFMGCVFVSKGLVGVYSVLLPRCLVSCCAVFQPSCFAWLVRFSLALLPRVDALEPCCVLAPVWVWWLPHRGGELGSYDV